MDRFVGTCEHYMDRRMNRIPGEAKDVLTYTYTAPLKAVNAAAVSVEGQWTP